ncbi:hypothetical protein AVEN_180040-1 [Araneus ventricosus]|uniref:Uncharacterized protein n=1 Tax=Araneus ventricosus TaxID=182803 RepID=A0A4Y2NXL6_ARAVE|nr:hypothetical protein AVEN_193802-1 [Araneus ventricosus]GBN44440.1 hypothetical protein AVEN_180040-1 [Araneus ventricosus]
MGKIKSQTIKNSWHNILTTIDLKENNKKKENQEHFEIKNAVLKLPGCEEATDNCVEEWLYGDEEITDDETEKIIYHAEGTAALDIALRYIEQQPDALPHNQGRPKGGANGATAQGPAPDFAKFIKKFFILFKSSFNQLLYGKRHKILIIFLKRNILQFFSGFENFLQRSVKKVIGGSSGLESNNSLCYLEAHVFPIPAQSKR